MREITMLYEEREQSERNDAYRCLFLPNGDRGYQNQSLERFRTSTKYLARPVAADIAFCVAAYAKV